VETLGNAKARVRLKARLALEEALPAVYGIVMDTTQPPVARVAAFKEIKDLSAVAANVGELGAQGNGLPSVTIVLGDKTPNIKVSGNRPAVKDTDNILIPGLAVLDSPVSHKP